LSLQEKDILLLIEGCINQERKAQERLYRNYYAALMRICLRFTKNEQDALTMLNTGFLKVFKSIHLFEPKYVSLYTWARTIIIRVCLDYIKANKKTWETKELDIATEVEIPPEIISKMHSEDLLKKIRELPPATASVFNLYVIEGYNHKEIAKLLTISEGTSKWHLSEARKQLKIKLNLI
jgi:RNA polymerase sigma factor (sigma-70 family)